MRDGSAVPPCYTSKCTSKKARHGFLWSRAQLVVTTLDSHLFIVKSRKLEGKIVRAIHLRFPGVPLRRGGAETNAPVIDVYLY